MRRSLAPLAAILVLVATGCSGDDSAPDWANPGGATDVDAGAGADATATADGGTKESGPPSPRAGETGAGDATRDSSPPPVPGATYGAKCASMDANELKAWEAIAIVRGKVKLAAIDCDTAAQQAARAHSNYMKLNGGTLTHTETQGNPGFTGVNFSDRLYAAGFTGMPMFEVAHYETDGAAAITGGGGWIHTIYHRIPFVSPEAKAYGFGASTAASTCDFGSGGSPPSATFVSSWPVDGDTGVPTTTGGEGPSPPIPGGAGYAISLQGGGALVLTTHTITGPSGDVAHMVLSQSNDTNGFVPGSMVFLVPNAGLASGAKYTVSVTGTVSGSAFTFTSSFTTG